MTLKIASNCDSKEQMEEALKHRSRNDHAPITMSTTPVRSSNVPELPDEVVVTIAGRGAEGPDGGTEHADPEVTVYRNGKPIPQPQFGSNPLDHARYNRFAADQREQAAREVLSDYDSVLDQNILVPLPVLIACKDQPAGAAFGYWLGRNPEFCAELTELYRSDPEGATLAALEKMNSLTDNDLAQYMTHRAFRKWRERR